MKKVNEVLFTIAAAVGVLTAAWFFIMVPGGRGGKSEQAVPTDDREHLDDRLYPMVRLGGEGKSNYPSFDTLVVPERGMDIAFSSTSNADHAHFRVLAREYSSATNNDEFHDPPGSGVRAYGTVLRHYVVRSITRNEHIYTDKELGCEPRNLLKCKFVGSVRVNGTFYLVLGQQVLGYVLADANNAARGYHFVRAYELGEDVVISKEIELSGVNYYPFVSTAQYKEGIHHLSGVLYFNPFAGTWTRAVWSGPPVHSAVRLEPGSSGMVNVVTRGFRPEDPEQIVVLNITEGRFTVPSTQ